MAMTLKLSPEVRKKTGLGETATAEEIVTVLNRQVDIGKAVPDQAQLAAARENRAAARRAAATSRAQAEDEAAYAALFPSDTAVREPQRVTQNDATAGLSAEEAAFYRTLFQD